MTRLLWMVVFPLFVWGSLGLWGLSLRTLLRDKPDPLPMTRNIVLQAIACGPIAFFVDWRKASRRIAMRARKYTLPERSGDESAD